VNLGEICLIWTYRYVSVTSEPGVGNGLGTRLF